MLKLKRLLKRKYETVRKPSSEEPMPDLVNCARVLKKDNYRVCNDLMDVKDCSRRNDILRSGDRWWPADVVESAETTFAMYAENCEVFLSFVPDSQNRCCGL